MFERIQAFPEHMIDHRTRCILQAAMKSTMCEKQVWRRRTGHPESATLEKKFFASCKNWCQHIAFLKDKAEDEGKKVPHAASRTSARLQRGKDFERQERRSAVPGQKRRERSGSKSRKQPWAQETDTSAAHHIAWKPKATVPGKVRERCSIERLATQREGLGVQHLTDLANLPLTGRGAFVLDGAKRYYVKKPWSDRVEGRNKGINPPALRRNNGKCEHVKVLQQFQRR